jgi:protoporphyrinogen oxidase
VAAFTNGETREISLLSRLRYGLFAFASAHRKHWPALETETARSWITRWCGKEVYEQLWQPLFALKFFRFSEDISAAWIWTRIKRLGQSRSSVFQEELGYIEGGTQTLIDELCRAIERMGGSVRIRCPVRKVVVNNGRAIGVECADGFLEADDVICTVPTPLISTLVPDLPV